MLLAALLDLLKENYNEGGRYDDNGNWIYATCGNTVYLANDKGGQAYVCNGIKGDDMSIVKYSIKSDGTMKNEGKLSRATLTNMTNMLNKATKYAINAPQDISCNKALHWISIKR